MENIITIIMTKLTKKSFNFLGGLPEVEKKYDFSLRVGFVYSQSNQTEVLKESVSENQAGPLLQKQIMNCLKEKKSKKLEYY